MSRIRWKAHEVEAVALHTAVNLRKQNIHVLPDIGDRAGGQFVMDAVRTAQRALVPERRRYPSNGRTGYHPNLWTQVSYFLKQPALPLDQNPEIVVRRSTLPPEPAKGSKYFWSNDEVATVVKTLNTTLRGERLTSFTARTFITKLAVAQQLALPAARHRKLASKYGLIPVDEPLIAAFLKLGWKRDGTGFELADKVEGPAIAAEAHQNGNPVTTATSRVGSLLDGVLNEVLTRLDRIESRVHAQVPADFANRVAELELKLERAEGDQQNAADFDTLIVDEIDQLRVTIADLMANRPAILPVAHRSQVERSGSGVTKVVIIGLRDRDVAVLHNKAQLYPELEDVQLRCIPADRSPFPIQADYALVMRWVSHAWYEHGKASVKDSANCRLLSHGGVSSLVKELRKIGEFQKQKRVA